MKVTNISTPTRQIKQVTYLFGAGASCGTEKVPSIPLVSGIPFRLKMFRKFVNQPGAIEKGLKKFQEKLTKGLTWLESECRSHASIDTFAKKLFLKGEKGEEDLTNLKNLLTLFLIREHLSRSRDPSL